jgi:uncharacterized protein (DUF697 family)
MAVFCTVSDHPEVDALIERCAYATAALTILPIPGSEIIGVMPLHVGMVVGIAHHHGHTLTRESAGELLLQIGATVGVSLVGSRLATTTAKILLPGLGGIVAAPFMYASTIAIGACADNWFARDGDVSSDELRDTYNRVMRGAKRDFDPGRVRDPEAVRMAREAATAGKVEPEASPEADLLARLKRAKQMHAEGLMSDEELEVVRQRILSEL